MARKKVVDADSAVAVPHPEDVKQIEETKHVPDNFKEEMKVYVDKQFRDKVAIEVLAAYIAHMGCDPEAVGPLGNRTTERNKDVLAKASYAYADAMLRARDA